LFWCNSCNELEKMKMRSLIFLTIMIISLLIIGPLNLHAQDLRDQSGIKTGSVEKDGAIRDKSGIKTGSFDDNGAVRDKSGIKIGSVDKDGVVRDKSGIKLGEIEDSGTVRDKSGIRIGSAEGVEKKKAAVMFFFKGL
jgi:hypothetical protein